MELTLRFAVRQGRIEYALVVLDDLEGEVEFAGDLVGVAFVHGFRYLAFEWVDELQRGFPSRPAFQVCRNVPSGDFIVEVGHAV